MAASLYEQPEAYCYYLLAEIAIFFSSCRVGWNCRVENWACVSKIPSSDCKINVCSV